MNESNGASEQKEIRAVGDLFFTHDNLPKAGLQPFRKIRCTPAVKILGAFHCLTSEGNVASCADGWLAVDSQGYPYPVNSFEFEATYRLVLPGEVEDVTEAE